MYVYVCYISNALSHAIFIELKFIFSLLIKNKIVIKNGMIVPYLNNFVWATKKRMKRHKQRSKPTAKSMV